MNRPEIVIIAALGKNRGLGFHGELLWRIPDDLKRFKLLTMGHPVIMGSTTYTSIGKPLPGRTNIVLAREAGYQPEGVTVAHSLEEALAVARALDEGDVFVIGGAQVYAQALPLADKLCLTLIDDKKEADVFFPPYEDQFLQKESEEERWWNGLRYRWVNFVRVQ